jgi:hypothetical protein
MSIFVEPRDNPFLIRMDSKKTDCWISQPSLSVQGIIKELQMPHPS